MTYAGTGTAAQSIRRLRQQLNVPNIRPIMDDIYQMNISLDAIQNATMNDIKPPTANVSLNGYRLINVADPIDDTDGISKKYIDGQVQALQTNIAGNTAAIAALQAGGGGGNTGDLPAREAIGFPYNHTQSLDVRTSATFNDVAIVKGQLGLPYSSTFSVDHRLNELEASRVIHGTSITNVTTTANTAKSVNDTQTGQITNLNQAVGIPYVGATSLNDRMGTIEPKFEVLQDNVGFPYTGATVLSRLLALEAKMAYFVGQGMVRAGDVGGQTTVSNPLGVSGIITSATRTLINSNTQSYITMNWADPGFNVIPLITWFNDNSNNIADSGNNDLAPVWLNAANLTRTQCKVYLEEAGGGGTQNVRLFVILYRSDQTLLIT